MKNIKLIIKTFRKNCSTKPSVIHSSKFKILVSTVLSARTRDENTEKASKQLFSIYPTAEKLANANIRSIEKLIKPCGFYKNKAKFIKALANKIITEYGGKVPSGLKELKSLPGVGQKTAQVVRAYAFGEAVIGVDTHVHRISNRIGLVKTKEPEKTEKELLKTIPVKYLNELNHLMVNYGQKICRPINPKCSECKICSECDYCQNKLKGK